MKLIVIQIKVQRLMRLGKRKKGFVRGGEMDDGLTELPTVSAIVTHDERSHRFISRSGLELVVGAIFSLALAALQEICYCALNGGLEGDKRRKVLSATSLDESALFNLPIERR